MRRHVLRSLLGPEGIGRSGVAAIDQKHGVEIIRAHGEVVDGPAEQRAVEALRSLLVRGRKLDPAKVTRRVLINVRHGGSIPQSKPAAECTGKAEAIACSLLYRFLK